MRLKISSVTPIGEIQNEFNKYYPFLKLEFFQNNIYQQPDFTPARILSKNKRLGFFQTALANGYIEANPSMKVKDLEKKFKDDFSLIAQVFRKSGNVWLQTTMTDDWTLEQQNAYGHELSVTKVKAEDISDFDLSRGQDD